MEKEDAQSSVEHYKLFQFVLNLFEKSFDNVVAVAEDNCAVKRSIYRPLDSVFIGCTSHSFNLTVKYMIEEHSQTVGSV